MHRRNSRLRALIPMLTVSMVLLFAALACNSDNMRARDLPMWTCPTDVPPPTLTMQPSPTVLAGTATPEPLPTFTPWPSPTPYQLMTDFPLGKHVQIGTVGGVGLGIWVWMDNTQIDGPFTSIDENTGAETVVWVASWDVTVENASWTSDYEFYPFAQIYAVEIIEANGTTYRTGAWGISGEAHDQIGIPRLELTNEATLLNPGDQKTVRVAAFIPGPEIWRMGYVLDPLDTVDIEEMLARGSIGSNVGIWINQRESLCANGEITPGPGGTQPAGTSLPGDVLLARLPTNYTMITRNYGCTEYFTGELGTNCPASARWWHNGVDMASITGTIVRNTFRTTGSVYYAGADDAPDCSAIEGSQEPHFGYGNYVREQTTTDGHSIIAWSGHLSAFDVSTGDSTNPGMIIGRMGSTGCSTGPHLHFSVKVDGLYVAPCSVIPGGCP